MWSACAAFWCRKSLGESSVNHSIITVWALPGGKRLPGASEEERAHVFISRSAVRDCVGAAFWGSGQMWSQISQSNCTLSSTHLQSFLHTLNMWNRDGPDGWAVREVGWREGRVCFRGACSAWITNYKRKAHLPTSWWSIWKFARLEVLRVGYSSESVVSPKLTVIKEMLHFPDQLSLYSLCTVPQQTICPMGLQPEIILFSLQ